MNLGGTFNVLEAIRALPDGERPSLLYTSTNKVYGRMDDVPVVERDRRYAYRDALDGIPESQPLDFHSPYGCSKGAADQYVRDYARIYGLRTVVFRMSCIYGPGQCGTEDQGWVAHFLISAAHGRPITIYGDGKQVRDLLFVDDLVAAFMAAVERIETVQGEVFNLGGGPDEHAFAPRAGGVAGPHTPEARWTCDLAHGDLATSGSTSATSGRPGSVSAGHPGSRPPRGCERLWQWVKSHPELFTPEVAECAMTEAADEHGPGRPCPAR